MLRVISKTFSIRKAADKYGIKAATLQHRIKKLSQSFEATRASSSVHTTSSPPAAQQHSLCIQKWLDGVRVVCTGFEAHSTPYFKQHGKSNLD